MSSLFTRGWIALVILVATPLAGSAQRGGNDADTYPANNYGDERPEAEPPRLLRGGLMHQLRSVTESVLGVGEEKRPPSESNRHIPKPPPLASPSHRPAPAGRGQAQENSRGEEQAGTSGNPNRSWAGQFLVPNYRERSQAPAPKQPMANERSSNGRVYLGQRSGQQRTAPPSGRSSAATSNGSDTQSSKTPVSSQEDAFPSGEIMLEGSASPALNDEAAEMQQGPAEVMVSHVPDVPYVPRKPVPKRDQKPSATAARSNADADRASSQVSPTDESKPTAPSSAKGSSQTDRQSAGDLSLDFSSESPQLPAATQSESGSTNRSSPKQSPSVPSLEVTTLPSTNPALPTSETLASESATAPRLPTLGTPTLGSPTPGLPQSGLLTPSLPQLSPKTNSGSTSNSATSNTVTSSLPTSSLPVPGFSSPNPTAAGSAAPSLPSLNLPDSAVASPSPATGKPELSATASPAKTTERASASNSQAPAASGNQERMRMEVPHVVVKLLGPGDLATGTPTSYELVVQNPDRIALSGLILRMETPPGVEIVKNPKWGDAVELEKAEDGATLLMWNVDQVAAGSSTKLGLDLNATASRNFAVAIEWAVLPQEGIDELTVTQADLQVALEGPVDVEKDVANVYRVRVSNPGNAAARNVKVQVSAATQQASQVEIGDLAAGQSEVVEMDLTFEKAGRLEIGAHALADGSLKRDTNVVVNVRQPVLQASLSLPKSVLLGGNVFATMELRNTGDGPARKVQAGLMIPAETEVINPPSGVTRQGEKLLWEVEIVPAGQVVTVPIELRLPNAGNHALKFACVTPSGALASAEATTTVEAFADLKLLVNDPPAPAPIGAPVVYELTVTNRGSRDARNVTILAQFSEGIEPQNATGLKNRVVPGQVLFDSIPTIAAGETVKVKLTAKASVAGMHRFRAEVRCEESDARLVEEESTRYLESATRLATPPSTLIQR